jgi:hypothetical protein
MGFTKALYYPTIDIANEDWLKSAILFWDEIHTIVPESMSNPYQHRSSRYLADEGLLKPVFVNPDRTFIRELSSDVLNYFNTNEGFQVLTQYGNFGNIIHRDKLPRDVERLFYIHPEKFSYEIQHILERNLSRDGWYQVDNNFATFYMTLLANKICEDRGIALLSDNSMTSSLSDKARLDNQAAIQRDFDYYDRDDRISRLNLAQGLLTNLIIQGIRVGEDSSLDDIIAFKKRHQDELGLFRTNVSKLTQSISGTESNEALMQKIEDIYKDDFLPSYNNLKKSLSGSGIKWASDNFMKISLFSVGTTALSLFLGLTQPHALLAGIGVSLVTSRISYNQEKRVRLRTNPYSYLLAASREV